MDDSDIEIIEDLTIIVSSKTTAAEVLVDSDPQPSSSSSSVEVIGSPIRRSDKITVDNEKPGGFDGPTVPKKVRRNKDEAMQIKVQQAIEKAEKKRIRDEARLQKENEKKKRKIEREAISSHKSKAEQHTFCHVGKAVFTAIGDLEVNAKMLFMDRNLSDQFVIEDNLGMRIEWRRKEIDVIEFNNVVEKLEYSCQTHFFAVVVVGDTFRQLVESNSIEEFVITQQAEYPVRNSQMIIICYGAHKLPSYKVTGISLMLYDECRAHLEFLKTSAELSLFMAQYVRGLAKAVSAGHGKLLVDIPKGVEDVPRDELVKDWWEKMLTAVDRMSHAQRRELLKKYPDPIAASKDFTRRGYDDVVKELSGLVCENGRRLGPQMAHRLFVMLTDTTGKPLID